ncbi:hypothetical protein AKJ41_01715 [candidate division MSBL1 archaeon SCGC-AAA259O05]|uniref:Uncharacterized protein n=1 Tax=candidate division MSBL1 archaeon SCGC-AAA259O05 TaxID=1698271 RepID=A0A133V4M0_9EURY|nr:hypothetical protein AKJ41_01715 [candidate division MSBL1 archaeon SCGC-AAA259O05]
MSYPLFIVLSGTETNDFEKVKKFVHPFKPIDLEPFVRYTLGNVLRGLKNERNLGKLDREFLEKVSESAVDDNSNYIVPPFPSNEYILDYLHDVWHDSLENKLTRFYKQYSYFVHSYIHSWQIYPFSSVLEFKILKMEIKDFFNTINDLVEVYLKECH